MKESKIIAHFSSDIEKVWQVVTDNKSYKWRSDLKEIIISSDGKSFVEVAKNNFKTNFIITNKDYCKKYQFDMNNSNMKGHWTGLFVKENSGTKIEFLEQIEVFNPIMNIFAKSYLKKQQNTYINDLKKALGE